MYVRQRTRKHDVGQRDERSHDDRPPHDIDIGGRQEISIGVETEAPDDLSGEPVEMVEALDDEREQRPEIDDDQPRQRKGDQQGGAERRTDV